MDPYSYDSYGDSSFQSFDNVITGNDPATYDNLSNFQSMDDIITNNQGYGWGDSGTWATGDPSTDAYNFGY